MRKLGCGKGEAMRCEGAGVGVGGLEHGRQGSREKSDAALSALPGAGEREGTPREAGNRRTEPEGKCQSQGQIVKIKHKEG